jgi:hypothetical protein
MLNCLTDIVGVTTNESDCITQGLDDAQKAQLKKSTSGLYLDDLPGGVHMKALRTSDATKGFYPMATGALANAAKLLENDLIVALNGKYQKGRKNFLGQIGRMSFAQTLNTTANLQGMRIRPVDYNDGVITLSRITLIVQLSATFNIYVAKALYKQTTAEVIGTYPITTVANAYTSIFIEQTAGGLKLPLVQNGELYEYWIYYDKTEAGGALPKDNKIACSTCGSSNTLKLADFLEVRGANFSDIQALNSGTFDDYSHGFTLDVAIKCDNEKLFCGQYVEDDAVATTMAHAVQFKAGELLIEEVLKSPDVNAYTTMGREYLWGKRNHFRAEYTSRIAYLANAIDVTASNCYVCREQANTPFFAGIYS